jgi:hypothetical protein
VVVQGHAVRAKAMASTPHAQLAAPSHSGATCSSSARS